MTDDLRKLALEKIAAGGWPGFDDDDEDGPAAIARAGLVAQPTLDLIAGALDSRINAKLDSLRVEVVAIRADLARLLPLADLLEQLASTDGQAPNVLGVLRMLTGRGGG